MSVDDAQFKLAMSQFASGVTVVTTEHDGRPFGMTVASFASLSLHPPLVLVCIEKTVKSHDAIAVSRRFAVNILGADQIEVSNRFAQRSEDKFAGVSIERGTTGVPIIPGSLCSIECSVREQLAGGDHSIFVGEVLATQVREGAPLLYFRSAYRELNA